MEACRKQTNVNQSGFAIIELTSKYNPEYRSTVHNTYVNFMGQRIGEIKKRKDVWNSNTSYNAYYFYYRKNGDVRAEYINRFSTLYAAKAAVVEVWQQITEQKYKPCNPELLTVSDNPDFFPTPSRLAGKMVALVDWKNDKKGIKTMLEPSAGKGDLVDCTKFRTFNGHRLERRIDIDCIETDPNLRHILAGKGYRVVHDDFLRFNTHKRYDLILMNPPFSEGAEHLLKAISLQQDGGQICCLLNAETIRNPYTNVRRFLRQKLDELGAKIVYVRDAFARAERRSDVEVAIVHIKIPYKRGESEIFSRLKKVYDPVMHDSAVRDLVGGSKIEQLLASYNIESKATVTLLREYNAMAPYMLRTDDDNSCPLVMLKIGSETYSHIDTEAVNHYMQELRDKYWQKLFKLPELTARFTSNILDEYTQKIAYMKDFDFSMFNIEQIISQLNDSLAKGVHESIMNTFDTLSARHSWYPESEKNIHYFSGWATNKAHKVNRKVILPINGCYSCYAWERSEINVYDLEKKLGDIEKSLDYIDRGVTGECGLLGVLTRAVSEKKTKNIMCKYFSVTFYKKGTAHITFHDQRIVDVLNIYAARGKNWLPPCYGKKKYSEMSPEERAVIDDFQGREEYEKVMQAPEIYLIENQAALSTPQFFLNAGGEE